MMVLMSLSGSDLLRETSIILMTEVNWVKQIIDPGQMFTDATPEVSGLLRSGGTSSNAGNRKRTEVWGSTLPQNNLDVNSFLGTQDGWQRITKLNKHTLHQTRWTNTVRERERESGWECVRECVWVWVSLKQWVFVSCECVQMWNGSGVGTFG